MSEKEGSIRMIFAMLVVVLYVVCGRGLLYVPKSELKNWAGRHVTVTMVRI